MKTWFRLIAAAAILLFGTAVRADVITLDASMNCDAGTSVAVALSDVTGNNGGPSDCWGVFDGNDNKTDGYDTDGDGIADYTFVSRFNVAGTDPASTDGDDIGLAADALYSGNWSFDPSLFDPDSFLLVIKAANNPGHGIWLFSGAGADSYMGTFVVGWGGDNPPALSHISIYSGPGGTTVPAPGTLALLGLGLLGLGAARRRKVA